MLVINCNISYQLRRTYDASSLVSLTLDALPRLVELLLALLLWKVSNGTFEPRSVVGDDTSGILK